MTSTSPPKTANCLALYTGKPATGDAIQRWSQLTADWFERLDRVPDVLLVNTKRRGRAISSREQLRTSLNAIKFNDVTSIEFYATTPGYSHLEFGWRIGASLTTTGTYYFWDDSIQTLDEEFITSLCKSSTPLVSPQYGIAYQRPYKLGTALYAVGIVSGLGFSGRDFDEADAIGKWSHEMNGSQTYLVDHFRDLYRFNLLSSAHLNVKVDGKSLETWVKSSLDFGSLTHREGDLNVWTMSDEQINAARHLFRNTDYLLCAIE